MLATVGKKADRWLAIRRLTEHYEPKVARAVLSDLQRLRGALNVEALAAVIKAGGQPAAEGLLARAATTPLQLRRATRTLEQTLFAGGHVAAAGLHTDLRFDATNPFALRAASHQGATLVKQVAKETKAAIREVITAAIETGKPPRVAAKQIHEIVGLTSRQAGRVEAVRASMLAGGATEAQAERIAARAGDKLRKARALTIARTECLPGETPIDGAVVRAAHRRWYCGNMAEIRTRGGRQFSATPNHPVLTNRGWVAAGDVEEGDYLVCHARQQHARAPGDPDVAGPPPTIREVFDAASAVGVRERRLGTEPDFHGDGRDGEIDVACVDRPLLVRAFAALYEPLVQQFLTEADDARAPLCHACGRLLAIDQQPCGCGGSSPLTLLTETPIDDAVGDAERLRDVVRRLTGRVSGDDVRRVDVGAVVRGLAAALVAQTGRLASRAHRASLADDVAHAARVDPFVGGDARGALAGDITLDDVVAVQLRPFRGHVYNLTTPYGYFAANGGVYTGNTVNAANRGQQELWDQLAREGVLPPDAHKTWITTPDDRRCVYCLAMDGQIVPLADPFVSLRFGERTGPTLHPNCRCAVGLVRAPLNVKAQPQQLKLFAPEPPKGLGLTDPVQIAAWKAAFDAKTNARTLAFRKAKKAEKAALDAGLTPSLAKDAGEAARKASLLESGYDANLKLIKDTPPPPPILQPVAPPVTPAIAPPPVLPPAPPPATAAGVNVGLSPGHVEAGPALRAQLLAKFGEADELHGLFVEERKAYAALEPWKRKAARAQLEVDIPAIGPHLDIEDALYSLQVAEATANPGMIASAKASLAKREKVLAYDPEGRRAAVLDILAGDEPAAQFAVTFHHSVPDKARADIAQGIETFRRLTGRQNAMAQPAFRAKGNTYEVNVRHKSSGGAFAVPTDGTQFYGGPTGRGDVMMTGSFTGRAARETMVHELGHHLEFADPVLLERARAFRKLRGERPSTLNPKAQPKVTKNPKYKGVWGYEDEWEARGTDGYAGRVYRIHGAPAAPARDYTEIVSMGLERLSKDAVDFARRDPEYFDFMMSVLRPQGVRPAQIEEAAAALTKALKAGDDIPASKAAAVLNDAGEKLSDAEHGRAWRATKKAEKAAREAGLPDDEVKARLVDGSFHSEYEFTMPREAKFEVIGYKRVKYRRGNAGGKHPGGTVIEVDVIQLREVIENPAARAARIAAAQKAAAEEARLKAIAAKKLKDEQAAALEATKKAAAPTPVSVQSWTKYQGQAGSNPGGFYTDGSGTKHYVKFPQKSQAQVNSEALSDSIYKELDIAVKDSAIVVDENGNLGLASKIIEGGETRTAADVAKAQGVKDGFVADAYLANWDVVGQSYDNIWFANGKAYRIDSGGTMFHRAQGSPKPYAIDDVPDLDSLRDSYKSKAADAFSTLTDAEIAAQARVLVTRLTPDRIGALVKQAGITGGEAEKYIEALLGRRRFLATKFGIAI